MFYDGKDVHRKTYDQTNFLTHFNRKIAFSDFATLHKTKVYFTEIIIYMFQQHWQRCCASIHTFIVRIYSYTYFNMKWIINFFVIVRFSVRRPRNIEYRIYELKTINILMEFKGNWSKCHLNTFHISWNAEKYSLRLYLKTKLYPA